MSFFKVIVYTVFDFNNQHPWMRSILIYIWYKAIGDQAIPILLLNTSIPFSIYMLCFLSKCYHFTVQTFSFSSIFIDNSNPISNLLWCQLHLHALAHEWNDLFPLEGAAADPSIDWCLAEKWFVFTHIKMRISQLF